MKPGIFRIIAGVVLFITGAIFIPLGIVLLLVFTQPHETQFKAPGTQQVSVEKAGRYYLWNDYQTIYNGKSYNRSRHIPDGMEIKITDATGALLPFTADTSISSSDNGSAANSIGYAEIKNPGKVTIEVSGGDEERIFSFAQSRILQLLGWIFGGLALTAFVVIGGIALAVSGIIKLVRSIR